MGPKICEAEAARDALAAALRKAGIQFPAMDVTPDGIGRPPRYGLVNLGEVSAPVVHALADVIAKGAAVGQTEMTT
ncbi:hypothetical protein [Streptomyces gilvosporeus]|uniref:Uncharacterized protein n=1 Tax=Streptomyces gilvosporeus TaxID=553510 RepID=A0A1V0TTR4_9ACTN|nr:hypothetical protein [Streptomyces gilvosporeus]ARF56273.1 hypothetical protein B1H19_20680 [Streptomyces gilvosporeus]